MSESFREYAILVPMWDDMEDPGVDYHKEAIYLWQQQARHEGCEPVLSSVKTLRIDRASLNGVKMPKAHDSDPDYCIRVVGRVMPVNEEE